MSKRVLAVLLMHGGLLVNLACGEDDGGSEPDGPANGGASGGGASSSGRGGSGVAGAGNGGDEAVGEGGGGGVAGAPSGSGWAEQCAMVTDHNAVCGKSSDDQAAIDDCISTRNCVPSVWSADVVDTVMSCLATLACDQADDDCIAATEPDQTPTKLALFEGCQDKATACPEFGGCLETQFLVSDQLALELQACLDEACDAVSSCMEDAYFSAIAAAGCTGELPFGG